MEKPTIERSIWINAPRERVWQAVTDPKQIAAWFLPSTLGAVMKRDDRDKLLVCLGEMEIAVALLEGMDAPRQVTSRSLPDRLLATTYTLDEEKSGTRLTVTMTGFESLTEGARQDRLKMSSMGWEMALENLKAYVDGAELPYPQPYVAPLFGYWREVKEKIAVERSIWINAPRERVWQAITDPAQVEKWFSPGTPWRLSALEVGGKLSVYHAETDTDMYIQIIEVVDAPRLLVTRSQAEPPDIPHVTTWTLQEERGGTRLTLTYTGYELEADDTRRKNMEENSFGFGMMMENLQASVEGKSLPYPGGF